MTVRPGGWHPDPTGRFSQRWHDGQQWTDHVVAANGSTISDPLPAAAPPSATPLPPLASPPAPPLAPPPFAAPPPSVMSPPGQAGPAVRLAPGITLVIAIAGLVAVGLSVLGLPWASGGGQSVSFLDLSDAARSHPGSGEVVARTYAAYGGFVLLGLTLLVAVLAGMPLPGRVAAARAWRIATSTVAGGAAVVHTVTVVQVFRGAASPEIGAWLGTAGYLVVVLAMVIGHHRQTPRGA